MELVYLWVEDYKNIKKQGFNFSPRFECEFKDEYETDENGKEKLKDNCELIIKPKEHIENFFGENINVTAIVGENGSGKSTICNSLIASQSGIIRVYSLGEEFYYFESKVRANYPSYFEKLDLEEIEKVKFSYDFFAQEFINDAYSHNYADFTFSVHDIFYDIFNPSYESIDLVKYKSMIGKVIYQYGKDVATLSEFKYERILFTLRLYNYFDIEKRERLNETIKISTSFSDINFEDIFKELPICKKFLSYIIYLINEEKILDGEPDWLSSFESFDDMLSTPQRYLDLTSDKEIKFLIENHTEYCEFLNFFKSGYEPIMESILLSDELLFSRNFYPLLELKYYDESGKLYDKLSHGERQIHSSMLLLYDKIINSDKNNFEIILDEIETSLHPKWQKTLILELIKLCKKISHKKIHIIIASHSPFILSDLPKENVIFLENGIQKHPFKENKQTFGANIHTLLSHGFFMKDGLMGEFAKEKIQLIIKEHEKIIEKDLTKEENRLLREEAKIKYENENKKNFWNIQSIIGDDYLKQVIKNHLVEIEKILYKDMYLDNEIERMKEKLKKLEALKNA